MMTFANFITIQYALLVDRIPALSALFGNLWVFAVIFILGYVPLSVVIGRWHRKNQLKVEHEALFYENPIAAKIWLLMLDTIEGRATEQERQDMRHLLQRIAKK